MLARRELARQDILSIEEDARIEAGALTAGGRSIEPVDLIVASLGAAGAHVLIGTPGRLEDVLGRTERSLSLRELELLVLDEACDLAVTWPRPSQDLAETWPRPSRDIAET